MKMRNLLFGVILGLFAFVHSAPVDTVTQDDIYHEAETDGYLVDNLSTTSLTTKLPKRNATVQEFQWPSSESVESDMIEGSALGDSNDKPMTSAYPQQEGEHYATTTPNVLDPQSSTSTELPRDTHDSSSDSYTTQIPQAGFTFQSMPDETTFKESDMIEDSYLGDSNDKSMTSEFPQQEDEHYATTISSVSHPQSSTSKELPKDGDDTSDSYTTQISQSHFTSSSILNEVKPSISPDHIWVSQTTVPNPSTVDFWSQERLGGEETHQQFSTKSSRMTSVYNTESSTESSTFTTALKMTPPMTEVSEGSGSGSGWELLFVSSTTKKVETEGNKPEKETSTVSSTFTTALVSEGSGLGSGLEPETEIPVSVSSTTKKVEIESIQPEKETSTASSAFTTALNIAPRIIEGSKGAGLGLEPEPEIQVSVSSMTEKVKTDSEKPQAVQEIKTVTDQTALAQNAGHGTPGWIIIVGFIVGVAALIMLCVAIATRDKWNRSSQAIQLETKTNTTNQQRELEMETFLHKDNPKENGNSAEYTVIPLDEFPEKCSSH